MNGSEVIYFIVNPASHSGEGKKLWKVAEKILMEKEVAYEAFFSEKRGDIARLAQKLSKDIPEGSERLIVVLGGDGSVNEAMQGLTNIERVRFSYIPTGSSNDLARDMGIPREVPRALAAILEEPREQRMDIGCVRYREGDQEKKRYFLVGCGIGYDAAVCAEALSSKIKNALNKIGLGKLTYLGIAIRQMVTIPYTKAAVRLDGEQVLTLDKMLFVVTMSHRYEGGGFCFCPQADAQDGVFDLCVVDGVPKWKFPFIIPFALFGKHFGFKGVEHYCAKRVEIKTASPLWVQTDGEIPGNMDRIEITIEKQKLRFIW